MIDDVILKYNYQGELKDFLIQIYKEFVKYLGEDKEVIIHEAFLSTPIVFSNNIYRTLKEVQVLDDIQEGMVKEGDLKRAAGVSHTYIDIKYDEVNRNFRVNDVKRMVVINAPDLETSYSRTTLIHELAHLVKSYYQEYKIEGDILFTRSGLIEVKEKLDYREGKVTKTLLQEKSVGLEEGLTSVMEEDISRILVDSNYKVSGYGVVNVIARTLYDEFGLKDIILNAQVLNEKDKLKEYFDTELMNGAYERLDKVVDKIYELTLKIFGEMFEPKKMNETSALQREVIKSEYLPLIEEMIAARQKAL